MLANIIAAMATVCPQTTAVVVVTGRVGPVATLPAQVMLGVPSSADELVVDEVLDAVLAARRGRQDASVARRRFPGIVGQVLCEIAHAAASKRPDPSLPRVDKSYHPH